MNVCFLLVLSVLMQYLFAYLIRLLMPQLVGITWFSFLQITVLSIVTVFIPTYLYIKDEKKKYFTDCFENVKISILVPLAAGIGICGQYTGIAANMPVNYIIYCAGGKIGGNVPDINSVPLLIMGIIVMCLIPAVFEEVLFRGVIFNYFRQYGTRAAIIISAILFAVMHLDYSNLFGTFLLGIICAIMVKHTNRLIYPMIAHFFLNLVSVISTYITNFEIIKNLYNDLFYMFVIVSVPLIIYLLGLFKQYAVSNSYADQEKYETVNEHVIEINEENSIKIIEHDVKENNIRMAFRSLLSTPYFYILMILFIYIGGTKL